MPFILLLIITVVAIVLFLFFHQNQNPQAARAVPLLAGAAITLIGFFAMPWVEVGGALEWIRVILNQDPVFDLAEWIGVREQLEQVRAILEAVTRVSGLTLSELPTVSRGLRVVIFLPLVAAISATITALLSIATPRSRAPAFIQIAIALIAMAALFFSIQQIAALGLDPELVDVVSYFLDGVLALDLGLGYWTTLAGLLVMAGGGALWLWQPEPAQKRISGKASKGIEQTQHSNRHINRPPKRTKKEKPRKRS